MKSVFTLLLIYALSSINLFGFDYGGFSLDETLLQNQADREIVETAFKQQVDVVNAVDLPPEMLSIIHSLPIKATLDETYSYAGEYFSEEFKPPIQFTGSYIYLNADTCFSLISYMPRTTLLHEFMHAIHDLYPPRNFSDPEIIEYFQDARTRDCYGFSAYGSSDPEQQYTEYLFTNYREFFAQTAVAYLTGAFDAEPFLREAIQSQQPEYYAFLQRFFNPADSRYNPCYNGWNLDQTTY